MNYCQAELVEAFFLSDAETFRFFLVFISRNPDTYLEQGRKGWNPG